MCHPFIVKLFGTYADPENLYFLCELALGAPARTWRRAHRVTLCLARGETRRLAAIWRICVPDRLVLQTSAVLLFSVHLCVSCVGSHFRACRVHGALFPFMMYWRSLAASCCTRASSELLRVKIEHIGLQTAARTIALNAI
eukprot:2448923-Pleurochrysis_carterae.AAC.1